jgi:hypothetical protein
MITPAFDVQGIPVFPNHYALKHVSGRVHQSKPWMRHGRRCYAVRIEKKWRKRFGEPKFSPTAYFMRYNGQKVLVMHPLLIDELKNSNRTWSADFLARFR